MHSRPNDKAYVRSLGMVTPDSATSVRMMREDHIATAQQKLVNTALPCHKREHERARSEVFKNSILSIFSLFVVYCQKQVLNVAMLSCVKTHENDVFFCASLWMLA